MAVICPPLVLSLARLGLDLAGYKAFFYENGTSTKQDAYTDSTETVELSNPATFDANGELSVWLGNNRKYTIVIAIPDCQDPPQGSEIILSKDDVSGLTQFTTQEVSGNTNVTSSDLNKIFVVDATSGNVTIVPPAIGDVEDGFIFYVKKIDGSANYVRVDPAGATLIDHSAYYEIATQDESISVFKSGSSWYTLNLRLVTEIRDSGGNLVANTEVVNSSVNYFHLLHSTTGNPIKIFAYGSDSNVDMYFVPKGTGDLYVPSGDLNLQGGGITAAGGFAGGGDISTTGGVITQSGSDARDDTVAYALTLGMTTSDTPAAGIGTGIKLKAESADESPSDFGALQFAASDVTSGSEDTYFSVLIRRAGAALSEAFRWTATGAYKQIHVFNGTADRTVTWADSDITIGSTASILQIVNASTASVITGSTAIPMDDTIPQITEGVQVLSQAFTPESATSTIVIDLNINCSNSHANFMAIALFDGSTNAIQTSYWTAVQTNEDTQSQMPVNASLRCFISNASTTPRTYSVRVGGGGGYAGDISLNGRGGTRLYGGSLKSSMVITEYSALT